MPGNRGLQELHLACSAAIDRATRVEFFVNKIRKNATWRWQWALLVAAMMPCSFAINRALYPQKIVFCIFLTLLFFEIWIIIQCQKDRRTESDAYEPIMQYAQGGSKSRDCYNMSVLLSPGISGKVCIIVGGISSQVHFTSKISPIKGLTYNNQFDRATL